MATKLFFIYAPEDGKHLTEIENQLKVLIDNGTVEYWHKGKLLAGSPWLSETEAKLNNAQIVLPIVSSNFLASDECNKWLQMADKLGKQIVPIIAGSCLWDIDDILSSKTSIPKKEITDTEATPITDWSNAVKAYATIVKAIHELVKKIKPKVTDTTDLHKQNLNNSSLKNTNDMPTPNLTFENGYALLIGIRYGHWKGTSLDNAVLEGTLNDVRDLYAHFTDPRKAAYKTENVTTVTEEKATKEGILTALDDLACKVENDPEATVVLYYSGHGETNGTDYFLAPYNFDAQTWVSSNGKQYNNNTVVLATDFAQKIAAIKAKKLLVILDCCHSAAMPVDKGLNLRIPFLSNMVQKINELFDATPQNKNLLEKMDEGSGRVIITSCLPSEKSIDIGTNGLFTLTLLEALAGEGNHEKDGYVDIYDIIRYLQKEVPQKAQKYTDQYNKPRTQTPEITRIERLRGRFIVCAYDIAVARGFTKQVEQPSLNNPTINNVENAAINSPITAGDYVHIGNIITNNLPNPTTEQTTPPNPNGMQEEINEIWELLTTPNRENFAEALSAFTALVNNRTYRRYMGRITPLNARYEEHKENWGVLNNIDDERGRIIRDFTTILQDFEDHLN